MSERKNWRKRCLSFLMAVVLTFSMMPFGNLEKVFAEGEEWEDSGLIINGDFESGETGWTLNVGSEYAIDAFGNSNEVDGSSHGKELGIYKNGSSEKDISVSQPVSVLAGTYKLTFRYAGSVQYADMKVQVSGQGVELEKKMEGWNDWDSWGVFESLDSFTVTEQQTITISISGKMPADHNGIYLDDIQLLKKVESTSGTDTWVDFDLITNGDFETGDTTSWTITGNNVLQVEDNSSATNNKTHILQINQTEGDTYAVLTQTISAVPAGRYKIQFDYEGAAHSIDATISVNGIGIDQQTLTTTGWDKWDTKVFSEFELRESEDIKVDIQIDAPDQYGGRLDNIKLLKLDGGTPAADNFTVAVDPSTKTINAGEAVTLSATVKNNGVPVVNLGDMKLWFWPDNASESGHAGGKTDCTKSDESGTKFVNTITCPCSGTYYIMAELKDKDDKRKAITCTTITVAETGSVIIPSFVNGDFETSDLTGWTKNCSLNTVGIDSDTPEGVDNEYFRFDQVKSDTSFSLSQIISGVPAGDYVVEFQQEGKPDSSSGLYIEVNGAKKALPDTTGWYVWTTVKSKVVTLTETGTITVKISGTINSGWWGGFDNFVLRKAVAADSDPEVVALQIASDNGTAIETGGTLGLTATVTIDGATYSNIGNYALSWKTENTVSGHEEGKTDAVFDASGLTASAKFPSAGTYYVVAELKNGPDVLATNSITIIAEETSSVVENDDLYVAKVLGLDENFIMGMDISSAISLFQSGVKFKDWDGKEIDNITDFCKFLAVNGITHIRIRVWNDPYTAEGNGYGGGNNDVAKAKRFADACRAAGIKMMVDFHCSDLWTDPKKQFAPKAWKDYSVAQKETALQNFIETSLTTIDPQKDTVTMVQVGNETTIGFIGTTSVADMCALFKAGAAGVKSYNSSVKVVIHVTNPEDGRMKTWADNLNKNNVNYDILATSYYPYWHGTLANLKSQLSYVKSQYGKDAMVAETSYAYTLNDSDGHDNTVRVGNNDTGGYITEPFTVQGQATSIRNLIEAVNAAGGLGVFYWEPAWITVGDTTGLSGIALAEKKAANKVLWEQYGSGWASSYSAEYDPNDAGKWAGGSAVDNEAMFYPDGTPTPGLHVWKYVRTGAKTGVSVEQIEAPKISIVQGESITFPTQLQVSYNSGVKLENVAWDAYTIDTNVPGSYTITGTVTFSENVKKGDYKDQTSASVSCTVVIKSPNLITDANDAGFEKWNNFKASGNGIDDKCYTQENIHSGKACVHWYWANASSGTVTYNKLITLEPGDYVFEYVAEGDKSSLTARILDASGQSLFVGDAVAMEGWNTWKTIPVSFTITETTAVKLQLGITIEAGGWGTADDMYLYCTKGDYTTHTVTFMSAGSDNIVKKVIDGYAVTAPTVSRANYTFDGWDNTLTNVTADMTVTAAWTPVEYAISYELNGGTVAEANPAIYTVETDLNLSAPSRTGCTFGGWYTDADCKTAFTYTKGSTAGDLRLYAKWTPISYSITYHPDGGTLAEESSTEYTIEDEVILKAPSKANYDFGGWHVDGTAGDVIAKIVKGTIGNKDLFATWTAKKYTITYELNGGVNAEANPAAYTVETDWTPADATRTSYTFGGWYTDKACEKPFTYKKGTTSGDLVLYAKWTYNVVVEETKPVVNTEVGEVKTTLSDTVEKLVEALLTPEEKEEIKTKQVSIYLEVEDKSATVTVEEKKLIEDVAEEFTVASYLDLTLFKKIGDSAPKDIPNAAQPITIEIAIPVNLINTDPLIERVFSIIRIHEGKASVLPVTENEGNLLFESDQFSVYAIAYQDKVKAANPSVPDTGKPSAPDTGSPSTPSTGSPSTPSAGSPSTPSAGSPSTPNTGSPGTGGHSPFLPYLLLDVLCFGVAADMWQKKRKDQRN